MRLLIRFEDNGTLHNDLVLEWGEGQWRCDSYYLALDGRILPDRTDAEKVRTVLRSMLEQWLETVRGLEDGGAAYLPYDFSDEYTAWLQCCLSGDCLKVTRGWTTLAGYSIFPSDVGNYLHGVPDFREDGPTLTVDRGWFVAAIEQCLVDDLAGNSPHTERI